MATDYTEIEKAEGKIQLMLQRLAGDYPFHVAVLERFRVSAHTEVGTMGVMVDGDAVALLHNPAFVLDTPAPELGGVLLHEVHHVVLKHVLADPADFPDEWARIVAEEVTVNEFVKEPLPPGGITLDMFPRLPPLESTRERYDRLKKVKQRMQIRSPRLAESPQPEGQTTASGGSPGTVENTSSEHQGKDKPSHRRKGGKSQAKTIDDHSVWSNPGQNREQAEATIRNIVEDAILAVGLDHVPPELQPALAAAGFDLEPGVDKSRLDGSGRGQLCWRRLLRRYVGQIFETRPDFNRPPRRFPEMVGIIPGRRRQCAKPKIMAVLDTSSSLTDELLADISAELAGLARSFDVLVVECDAVIHRVYDFACPLEEVCGRGGTDLRPPFKREFLKKHRPDLVIYFTDGDGPAPARAPKMPVVWCLVPDGEAPATWGRVIVMKNS